MRKGQLIIGCNKHIGESHLRKDMPLQDASDATFLNCSDNSFVVIVSDGHGGKKHFRSERGSEYAVEATKFVIKNIVLKNYKKIIKELQNKSLNSTELLETTKSQIIMKWVELCSSDKKRHPYCEDDKFNSLNDKDKLSVQNINTNNSIEIENLKAYGCTLIVYACFTDFALLLQIGDGTAFIIDSSNNIKYLDDYVKKEDELEFNYTTSMCQNDALQHFNGYYFAKCDRPNAVILSSDGVINSFESKKSFEKFMFQICDLYIADNTNKRSNQSLTNELYKALGDVTKYGSMDDVSVAFFIHRKLKKIICNYLEGQND